MIPLPHIVTIKQSSGLDKWGILQHSEGKQFKGRVKYAIDTRVAGKTTGQPVTNIIPTGSMILELAAEFTHDDLISFVGKDGRVFEIKPKEIKPIGDLNAAVMFWKVTF